MIGLILIIILALVGPLISKHDFAEQNVDYRNLPQNSRIRQSSFLPFDGTGSDGKDAYAKWELKKIIGLEQINLVEIYGHVHGRHSNFSSYWYCGALLDILSE